MELTKKELEWIRGIVEYDLEYHTVADIEYRAFLNKLNRKIKKEINGGKG